MIDLFCPCKCLSSSPCKGSVLKIDDIFNQPVIWRNKCSSSFFFFFYKNRADDRWLRFSSSIPSNTSHGGVTQECLPTEPGDNGTKLEGGWAGSRSNLRELNKSWPLRDFIVQKRGLLLCAVTESGATPLSVNSRSAASSETCNTAPPTNPTSWLKRKTWSINLMFHIPVSTSLLKM